MNTDIGPLNRLIIPELNSGTRSPVSRGHEDKHTEFSEVFGKLLQSVNQLQKEAANQQELMSGKSVSATPKSARRPIFTKS